MASSSDKFMKVGNPGTATTLSAPGYTIGATSINVASTTNFPTDTGVIFAIDRAEVVNGEEVRVDGSYCVFSGVVTSSTAIGSLNLLYGTAQDYSAGALTRVYITVSSLHTNRIIDGLLNFVDQDATLKAGSVDNAGVLASNVVTTAKILDANVTTAKIADSNVTTAKIADDAVTSAKLAPSKTVDANLWIVYDFGTFKKYIYGLAVNVNLATLTRGIVASPVNLPVGVTFANTAVTMGWVGTFPGHAIIGMDTSNNVYLGNGSNSTLTFTGTIYIELTDK